MTLNSWQSFVLRTAIGCAAVFTAVRLALAREGVSGGAARSFVTIAGTITGAPSPVRLTFTFRRADGTALCAPTVPSVVLGAGGAFSAQVPIDAPCPATMFDGSNVQVDVAVNDTAIVGPDGGFAVNPVPYAHYASQYGTPECPVGYARDTRETGVIACRKCRGPGPFENCYDDMVRVGDGASAFWIDRYEATIWASPVADGTPLGTTADDYPAGFPDNGQWMRPPGGALPSRLYAWSVAGSWRPSANATWFQAQAACRSSGKRLPTGEEWLAAAHGSDDFLLSSNGADGRCVTNTAIARVATRSRCVSVWGAQDMIGNVLEWTADWAASVGRSNFGTVPGSIQGDESEGGSPAWPDAGRANAGWPAGAQFGGDIVYSVSSAPVVLPESSTNRFGVPSAILRGGCYRDGTGAGVFYTNYATAPSFSQDVTGFRCVIPR